MGYHASKVKYQKEGFKVALVEECRLGMDKRYGNSSNGCILLLH